MLFWWGSPLLWRKVWIWTHFYSFWISFSNFWTHFPSFWTHFQVFGQTFQVCGHISQHILMSISRSLTFGTIHLNKKLCFFFELVALLLMLNVEYIIHNPQFISTLLRASKFLVSKSFPVLVAKSFLRFSQVKYQLPLCDQFLVYTTYTSKINQPIQKNSQNYTVTGRN